MRFYNTW